MKYLITMALAGLCLSCTQKTQDIFEGAEWIGTDEVVLNAPYLGEFSLSFDLASDRTEAPVFYFGGNDERLLNRNLNHMGIANRKDEVYFSLSFGQDRVTVSRRGYDADGRERELQAYALPSEWHEATLHVKAEIEAGVLHLAVNDSLLGDTKITPNEQTGGDYIVYPILGEIGCNGTFQHVEVRNLRSPYTLYYGAAELNDEPLFNPSHLGMPVLASTLELKDKAVESATLYATAHGVYEILLNDQKVGEDYFAPGFSQYNRTLYYQTYDITDMLKTGENQVTALLGEGWWMGPIGFWSRGINHFGDQLALMARLVVRYTDGEEQILATNDKDWKVSTDGEIRYSSRFHGEVIDARCKAETWKSAQVLSLDGHLPSESAPNMPAVDDYSHYQLLPQPDEGVQLRQTLTAQHVDEVRPGVFVYDMGQNMAGLPQITFRGLKEGQMVRMRYAEVRYPDMKEYALNKGMVMMENIRAAFAQDLFYSAGKTTETFAPHYTLHGYRYVEISGIDHALPLEDVQGRVLSSIRLASGFECSNPLVNRLWQNIQWSTLGNFISIPTDCPQRNERLGWGGDINVFSRTSTFIADNYDFLRRHMRNLRDLQADNGMFPDIAPVNGGFGGFLWGSAGITVAYEAWRQSGRTEILEEHYDAMKRYMEFVRQNYIEEQTGLLVQSRGWGGLGDWLNLEYGKLDNSAQYECYYIFELQCMAEMADALGLGADATNYRQLAQERKDFYVSHYIESETGKALYSNFDTARDGQPCDYQAMYILPLAFDVIDDPDLRHKMTDNLVAAIERENSTDQGVRCPTYSLMTGFVTTAWICQALSNNGRADVAYRLLQTTTYPSWLYPVTQGATTIWERLNSYNDFEGFGGNNSMNSFNHYSFGAVGQWMMTRILGIDRDPASAGFQHFTLHPIPDPTQQMSYARGWYDTPFGAIRAGWECQEDGIRYSFTIPSGCSATLIIEGREPQEFGEGTYDIQL